MGEYPDILTFDTAMVHSGRINSYANLNWNHRWYEHDKFSFLINKYRKNVDSLVEGAYLGYLSPLGGWNIGCVDSIRKVKTAEGMQSEMWTVEGRGIEAILAKRQMAHAWATGDGFDTQTSAPELNMRHYIDAEAINPTDTARAIAGLTLESVHSPALGAAIEYKARMPLDLPTVLYAHCIQTGLSWGLVWSGTGFNFEYRTYQGTDRSTGTSAVILSIDRGNVKAYDYVYSILDKKDFVYVGGAGDGAARTLVGVYSGTAPSGINRNETFVDASECTETAELVAKGSQILAEKGATQTLDFTYNHLSPSYVLGTDFNIGDTVVVDFPDVATLTSRITGVTEQYDDNGKSFGLSVGKKAPDYVSILKAQNDKINTLARR